MEKKIICITGPSGSGKTTLAKMLKKYGIPELTSHTTRPKRNREIHGEDYYFVTEDEFLLTDKVESSEYAGHLYGLSKSEVKKKLNQSDIVILVSDINGTHAVKAAYPDITKSVFLEVSVDEMVQRMRRRGDDSKNIEARILNAKATRELQNGKECDYIVRNKNLNKTIQSILQIAMEEER